MTTPLHPGIPKGFRDLLPHQALQRERLLEQLRQRLRLAGYMPIDTPVLEYSEVLLRKSGGETAKQLYRFTDNGGRDLGLRFDLTVPLARYMALHHHELVLPFRRYHIGKVFRGENTQKGRYREFIQCDFDILGDQSCQSEFEIIATVIEICEALRLAITIKISHIGLLPLYIESHPTLQPYRVHIDTLRTIIDKHHKVGREVTTNGITELDPTVSIDARNALIDFIELGGQQMTAVEALRHITNTIVSHSSGIDMPPPLSALRNLLELLQDSGLLQCIVLDPAITRGLDYYSGLVFETFLRDDPHGGSICSGGRYDWLVRSYGKIDIPAVGASIGIDRLLALASSATIESHSLHIMLCIEQADILTQSYKLATQLRGQGIEVTLALASYSISKQFIEAERRGMKHGVFYRPTEEQEKRYELRDLTTRERAFFASPSELIAAIKLTVR